MLIFKRLVNLQAKTLCRSVQTPKSGPNGARTHDPGLIRPMLYHLSYKTILCNPGGTRTPSLEIRSLTPYPVGPQGLDYWKWGGLGPRNGGHGTERTKIMVPPVGFEPTHLIRYLNLSQAP